MSDAVQTLINLTGSATSTPVRIEAIRSLASHLHDERAVRTLVNLTGTSTTERVRLEAVKALGRRG